MSQHRKPTLFITVLLAITADKLSGYSGSSSSPPNCHAGPLAHIGTGNGTNTRRQMSKRGYGIGDPYFPGLGNPGYDAQNYAITLDVDPESGEISGKTTIEAVA